MRKLVLVLVFAASFIFMSSKPVESSFGVVCERYDTGDGRSYTVWSSGGDICLRVEEADGSYEWHEIDVITALRLCNME